MAMVVVLPAPLPPSSATVVPRLEGEADVVDRGHRAVNLGEVACTATGAAYRAHMPERLARRNVTLSSMR